MKMADAGPDGYEEYISAAVSKWKLVIGNRPRPRALSGPSGFIGTPTPQELVPGSLPIIKSNTDDKYVKKIRQSVCRRIKDVLDKNSGKKSSVPTTNWLIGCVKDGLVEVETEAMGSNETTGLLEGKLYLCLCSVSDSDSPISSRRDYYFSASCQFFQDWY